MSRASDSILRGAALLVALVLAGCGGGGGGGGAEDSGGGEPSPTRSSATIRAASGGALELKGIAAVRIAAGVLPGDATVVVEQTEDADLALTFEDTASIFHAGERVGTEVRIQLGGAQPTGPVSVTLVIPPILKDQATAADEVRAMYLNVYDDGEERSESMELLPARGSPSASSLTVELPREAFYPRDGFFEAFVVLSLTPTAPAAAKGVPGAAPHPVRSAALAATPADQCMGTSILSPVDESFPKSSSFGPRERPTKNGSAMHLGIDYAVPEGTAVKAVADGRVSRIRINRGNIETGYGYYMELTHDDGSISRYAHLTKDSALAVGTKVKAGDVIARSGNTGDSTGPHLHFEYAPNGKLFEGDGRVDPAPCIGAVVSGSLSVSDNGNLADDAFSVTVDGRPVCSTSVGAANNCAMGQLRRGTYVLRITAVVAPDNEGTYLIVLNSPRMKIDGQSSTSGVIAQGASASFTLVVE